MSVNLFGSNHDVYVCMEMTKITVASYKYYLMSGEVISIQRLLILLLKVFLVLTYVT